MHFLPNDLLAVLAKNPKAFYSPSTADDWESLVKVIYTVFFPKFQSKLESKNTFEEIHILWNMEIQKTGKFWKQMFHLVAEDCGKRVNLRQKLLDIARPD